MWFVGVNLEVYGSEVFPWHSEPYKYEEASDQESKKKEGHRNIFTIRNRDDVEKYRETVCQNSRFSLVKLKPVDVSLIRDKDFILDIASMAKERNATIVLDGGMLSHAYYQFRRSGVNVKTTFSDKFKLPPQIEIGKLVRDGILDKIQFHGEKAHCLEATPEIHVSLLRRKLIEEAFEVFEAKNRESLIEELADTLEVIEALQNAAEIPDSELRAIKERKKEKAGGFSRGLILERTSAIDPMGMHQPSDVSNSRIKKRSDTRHFRGYSQEITNIKIPVYEDVWDIDVVGNSERTHTIRLSGKREGTDLTIEVSSSYQTTLDDLSD
jgi:predicted house-cleaning noncanonical NTP pyrophosphatase (MazG superfamily)